MLIPQAYREWLAVRLAFGNEIDKFRRLFFVFDTPAQVLSARRSQLAELVGNSPQILERLHHPCWDEVTKEMELLEQHQVHLVSISDEDYPENLREASCPPALLYVKGELWKEDRFSISVVGSRLCTRYGRAACEEIATGLVKAGFTVVSGLALGIDTVAHQAALRGGGRTIAVVGNGLARCYPAENQGLQEEIACRGALLSEYPMERIAERYHFPVRNYVLASLSLATVVVEAGKKSGALTTAYHALEENRALFAVPGDIFRAGSQGSNELIKQGARLAQNAADILEELGLQLTGLLEEHQEDSTAEGSDTAPAKPLDAQEQGLLDWIRNQPLSFDQLVEKYGIAKIGWLSQALLELELTGLIRQGPGKLYRGA